MRVAICVITCRRPRWLATSLDSLARLRMDGRGREIAVLVVDNDDRGGAEPTVVTRREEFPWPLFYEIEPQPGISFARNRAVRAALAWKADFVAFLDDDETASTDWLVELLDVQARLRADVVTGPVVPAYEPGVPGWVVRGRFFERERHRTGTGLDCARTGNCLIASAVFGGRDTPFHPAFALTGGGDTYFFRQAHKDGATIVWADEAIVQERVPTSRATVRWLLRRAYRGGASFAHSERMLHRSPTWMGLRICTGTLRGIKGLALLPLSLFLGKSMMVRALQTMCIGAGLLTGILGASYREYTVIHGE